MDPNDNGLQTIFGFDCQRLGQFSKKCVLALPKKNDGYYRIDGLII